MTHVTFVMTDMMLVLGLAAVLALFGFLDNMRIGTFVNVRRSFIMIEVTFDLAALLVFSAWVLVVHAMFNMTVVVTFVTLHGSLLRSCCTV
jgi:riboflavin transporter FmnP